MPEIAVYLKSPLLKGIWQIMLRLQLSGLHQMIFKTAIIENKNLEETEFVVDWLAWKMADFRIGIDTIWTTR